MVKPGLLRRRRIGIAEIAAQDFERRHAACVAAGFLRAIDAAEREAGATLGFLARVAVLHLGVDVMLEMEAQLVVQLAFQRAATKDRAQAVSQIVQHRVVSCRSALRYVISRICPTATVRRRQASACASSCARPLRVSS